MATVLFLPGASRGIDDSAKCDAAKLKESGKYYDCRLKAESKSKRRGTVPDFADCEGRFDVAWSKLESRYSVACTVTGDAREAREQIAGDTAGLTARLGGSASPECGDGLKNGVEQCDGTDLGSTSCATLGFTIGGDLACTTGCAYDVSECEAQAVSVTGQIATFAVGDDGDFRAGAPLRFVDNADGTVSDDNTGLTWEKKTWDGGVHDFSAEYAWEDAIAFVDSLNTMKFAGHGDWRLPNRKELETIVNLGTIDPAVSSAFNTNCVEGCTTETCSCTRTAGYWSSTTYAGDGDFAWYVSFGGGFENIGFKGEGTFTRAVRGSARRNVR